MTHALFVAGPAALDCAFGTTARIISAKHFSHVAKLFWNSARRPEARGCRKVRVSVQVPEEALAFGFDNNPIGTHISRTIMLADLRSILAACDPLAKVEAYRSAVVDENVLLKPTLTTRKRSYWRLRELYRFDTHVLLFQALRDLWDDDNTAQPLLAVLCATATDPILRSTAATILSTAVGIEVTPHMLAEAVQAAFPDRYNATSLASIGRNVASSWQQSGHLQGKLHKVRAQAESRPAAVAYALLFGYLCGARGEALFHTLWAQLLDAPVHVLREQAFAASQRGWLEYRYAGDVTDISFRYLLREQERG